MILQVADILRLLICPRCKSPLGHWEETPAYELACTNEQCESSRDPFVSVRGQPVLIDFDNSILEREGFTNRDGASQIARDPMRKTVRSRIRKLVIGVNPVAVAFAVRIIEDLTLECESPIVLVIGGGEIGSGTESLYNDRRLRIIGSDIYSSPNTTLVADGHALPIKDQCVDGVWIQAVLEHVLNPDQVVAEIHRVLKPGGLVFADTPFMQQVHEGAFDFTRYSLSGHRWLFRRFELVSAGYSGGPGTTVVWSIKYFVRSLTKSHNMGIFASAAIFWLRYFDRLFSSRYGADGASAVFFYGRKADRPITPKEIVAFYEDQRDITDGQIAGAASSNPTT
jgi:hypothetical protein